MNIVPDLCGIDIDRRLIPGEDAKLSILKMREVLDRRLGAPEWLAFGEPWVHMPSLAARAGDWLPALASAIKTATGHEPSCLGVPFGTDAGPLSEAGTPCVVFGPGDIAQAHTRDEWIELEQVRLAALAYYQIALELGARHAR